MELTPTIIAAVIAIVGGLLALKGLISFFARPISGGFTAMTGAVLVTVGIIGVGGAINIASYTQLTEERPLAKLAFYQSAQQEFTATLTLLDENQHASDTGAAQEFLLKGDEWRLEGKMIKWQGYGNLLGLDTLFKFDRISGRYQDPEQERNALRTLYQLSTQPGLDLWSKAREIPMMNHLLDARYGTGTYLPMHDKAEYLVSVSQSGLVARPTNDAAKGAIDSWF